MSVPNVYLLGQPTAPELVEQHGATVIHEPETFEFPEGKLCVCVLENVHFTAAVVCTTPEGLREMRYEWLSGKTWLLMDREVVATLVSPVFVPLLSV